MQRSSINALLFAVKHWETKKFSCKKLLIKLRPSQSIQKPHNAYSLWTERKKTWCDLLIPSWEQAFPLIWNMCNMHIRPVHFGILSRLYANLKEENVTEELFHPKAVPFKLCMLLRQHIFSLHLYFQFHQPTCFSRMRQGTCPHLYCCTWKQNRCGELI